METAIDNAMDSDISVHTDGEKKPAGACSSCHRRKLKCDRMPICSNCKKAEIPCVYSPHPSKSKSTPTTRDGRRKPRGPYQKGRTVREKELEHIVEILQEKCTLLEAQVHSPTHASPGSSHGSAPRYIYGPELSTGSIEDTIQQHSLSQVITSDTISIDNLHPSPAQIFELWLIYTTAVDPVTKILHCPSFSAEMLDASRNPHDLTSETQARLFSVYLAALNVLEPEEVLHKFGRSKDTLMSLYSTELMKILFAADGSGQMTFRLFQALVIYMGCLRRQPGPGNEVISLFSFAVRSAERIGLDNSKNDAALSALEVQLRRRAWWTICRQESAYAEEIHTRKQSIMHSTDVPLPLNLEDHDIDPGMTQTPEPRVGVTGMSFVIGMMDIVRTVGRISSLVNGKKKITAHEGAQHVRSKSLKEQSKTLVKDTRARIELEMLQYCDPSRSYDWLLLIITKIVLSKIEILVLECPSETDTAAFNMFHDVKVALSLDIIECHQLLLKQEKLKVWRWSYRNTQQWYATIYVLEELARRPDAAFASRVWQVVDIVFADMDLLNKHGMKSEDRSKLLEVHGRAIEAREEVLKRRGAATQASVLPSTMAAGNPGTIAVDVGAVNGYPSVMRSEPWQIDQSLFDVQEAELTNLDDFFWPSS